MYHNVLTRYGSNLFHALSPPPTSHSHTVLAQEPLSRIIGEQIVIIVCDLSVHCLSQREYKTISTIEHVIRMEITLLESACISASIV